MAALMVNKRAGIETLLNQENHVVINQAKICGKKKDDYHLNPAAPEKLLYLLLPWVINRLRNYVSNT